MRIEKLILKNFRSHRNTVLELVDSILFEGRMAAAKALFRWLWNTCSRDGAN